MQKETYEITTIQIFDYVHHRQVSETENESIYSYSANVILNDKLVIALSGDFDSCNADIPTSAECYRNNEEYQDWACENLDANKLIDELGIENNIGWLEDQPHETMNPENMQYRNAENV